MTLRSIGAAALVVVLGWMLAEQAAAEPSELAQAERNAVGLLREYCPNGPGVVYDALDPEAPLRRLSRPLAEAEIEVRLGPACTGEWTLAAIDRSGDAANWAQFHATFGEGFEEIVTFAFSSSGSLLSVRLGSEPILTPSPTGPEGSASVAHGGGVAWLWLSPLVLLAGAALCSRVPSGRSSVRYAGPPAVAALVVLGLCGASCGDNTSHDRQKAEPTKDPLPFVQLGALADLRQALTLGNGVLPDLEQESVNGSDQPVVALWRAASALAKGEIDQARELLSGIAADAPLPAAHFLRARAALFAEGDLASAMEHYNQALAWFRQDDLLLMEAAEVARLIGRDEDARVLLREADDLGSRQPEVYYGLARVAILDDSAREAQRRFRQAFELRPMAREEVLEDPLLSLLADPAFPVYSLLEMGEAFESETAGGEDALSASDGAEAGGTLVEEVIGRDLRLRKDAWTLDVAGGDGEASPSAERSTPAGWLAQQRRRALRRFGHGSVAPASLSSPGTREELSIATEALVRESQWTELEELTASVDDYVESLPTALMRFREILQYRALALQRLGKTEQATHLMALLAANVLQSGRRDPGTLYQLAELAGVQGRFDVAEKLIHRAYNQLPTDAAEVRINQLQLERRLEENFEVMETPHFRLLYPPGGKRRSIVLRIGKLLEAERARLTQTIQGAGSEVVDVHILSFDDFAGQTVGMTDVVGLFDGRIRVPLADVWGLPPVILDILTHELTHALIASATKDQAPAWVQEGIAQLMEMDEVRVNSMPDYLDTDRYLAFPVINDVLRNHPNGKLVAAAYDEAFWVLCYFQSEYGSAGIRRLLESFRDGATTDQALIALTGKGAAALDADLRAWWREKAPSAWKRERVDYGTLVDFMPYDRSPKALSRRWFQQ